MSCIPMFQKVDGRFEPYTAAATKRQLRGSSTVFESSRTTRRCPSLRPNGCCRPERLTSARSASEARPPEAFDAYHRAIFDAIWIHDRDIEDPDVLADIAVGVGADPQAVRRSQSDKELIAAMDTSRSAARNEGITGTPGFLFNGSFAVVGLQPVEFFDRVASRLSAQ